jgi:hypothetical protein
VRRHSCAQDDVFVCVCVWVCAHHVGVCVDVCTKPTPPSHTYCERGTGRRGEREGGEGQKDAEGEKVGREKGGKTEMISGRPRGTDGRRDEQCVRRHCRGRDGLRGPGL